MAEETKQAEVAPAANTNAQAENDVKNVLAELKGESADKKDQESAGANGDSAEAKEEAEIIAAANKMGQEAKATTESNESKESGKERGQQQWRGRGTQGRRGNHRDNIKSDLTMKEETSDPAQIRKQVEFYFSDSNLPMDKFLLTQVGGSANRPVEISVLHSFKRMRRFQPFSAIVDALKDSTTLELTDDNTRVRRKVPLPANIAETQDADAIKVFEDEAMPRSIYAKGFGKEGPSTQFDIEAFFTPYGPTNAIRLRRTYDKIFKGSVFVEFENEDLQKAFLALDPKPKWKGDTELLIKSKKDYCDEKVEEIKAGRVRASERPNRGRGGNRGGRNERDWRDRRAQDQKEGFNKRGRGGHRRGGDRRDNGNRNEVEKDSRGVPTVKSTQTESKPETSDTSAQAGQKRPREEADGAQNGDNGAAKDSQDPPAKKVDVKDG